VISTPAQTEPVKVIHVKVVGGNSADIYEIGNALKKFKAQLPFKLEFIITDDRVELRDVDLLVKELYKLKKQIEQEKLV
jgi:hypothetical protein